MEGLYWREFTDLHDTHIVAWLAAQGIVYPTHTQNMEAAEQQVRWYLHVLPFLLHCSQLKTCQTKMYKCKASTKHAFYNFTHCLSCIYIYVYVRYIYISVCILYLYDMICIISLSLCDLQRAKSAIVRFLVAHYFSVQTQKHAAFGCPGIYMLIYTQYIPSGYLTVCHGKSPCYS